jgi:hypothetical protein
VVMDKKFLCNWTTMTKFVCATKLYGNIEPQSKCTTLKNAWNSFRHPSAFETSYRNKEHEDVLDNALHELRGPWNTARLASLWHLLLMQLKVVVKIEPSYCAQRFRFALQSRLYDILLNTLVYETYKLGEILGYD